MVQSKITLSEQQLSDLRRKGLIAEDEFAFIAGDLIVAENPVSNTRRVIGDSKLLVESSKRVLRG